LRKVSKVYRMGESEVHALREIDLELLPGEFVVLLGASGSGKSTLLNILGGLDPPTAGEVHFPSLTSYEKVSRENRSWLPTRDSGSVLRRPSRARQTQSR
jgi:ABC-type lipoprotein export system ATPase subunit